MSRVLHGALLLASTLALSHVARGQAALADSVRLRALGDSAIIHKDWKELVSLYEPATRAHPNDGLAWFRLGAGLHELGERDPSIAALRHAVTLKFQTPQAELRLARQFAHAQMIDSAAVHLELAATAGVPVELITTEPDLAPVRKDPRVVKVVSALEERRYPCRSQPEAHQFDFWIGDWAVTAWNATAVAIGRGAENHISPDLEHCVIHEHWISAIGSVGESWNFWDSNRHAWRQIWMDPSQWSLDYEGEYKEGAMRFHGWTLGPNGERRLEKLTFFNISADTVRQLFEQSTDSGHTWRTTFDGRYVRMKRGGH